MSKIPQGWKISTIAEIAKDGLFCDGDWVESKDQDLFGKNRLIQLADIGDGYFINKSVRFLNDEQFERLRCTQLCENDILIARMPDPIGRACIFPSLKQRCSTVVDIAILRTNNVNKYWLMSAINASIFRKEIVNNSSGTTRTRIGRNLLSEIPIPLPPPEEQKKIAEILSSVDRSIEATEKLIAKLSDLKKALMQELFTQGIGHTQFKDSPLGRIPADWEVKHLKHVIDRIIDCEHKTAPFIDIKKYFVACTNNIRDGQIDFESAKYTHHEGFVEWTKRAIPQSGDVIFTREAPAGEAAVIPPNLSVCLGQRTVLLKFEDTYKGQFFVHALYSPYLQKHLKSVIIGTTVSRINIEDIENLYCLCPPLAEQTEIASILSANDTKIEKAQKRLDKLKDMKKGLMQNLLTGKVRVSHVNTEKSC